MPLRLTKAELETIIRCSADQSTWDICTADPRVINYLNRMGWKSVEDRQFHHPYVAFTLPFRKLRFQRPQNRAISDAQKEKMRNAASKFRNRPQD